MMPRGLLVVVNIVMITKHPFT